MSTYSKDCLTRKENIIFVVDDDDFIRSLAMAALLNYGQVYEYKDTQLLIEDYETLRPNIVFLDIVLENDNGMYILEDILKTDNDACVYMMSANSTRDNIVQCKKIGAKGFIGKPFSRKQFRDALSSCPTLTKVDIE